MSETMENAALNSGEIADRTPAAKAEETKAQKAESLAKAAQSTAALESKKDMLVCNNSILVELFDL